MFTDLAAKGYSGLNSLSILKENYVYINQYPEGS